MFVVYVLRSESNGKLYIGQNEDLDKRLEEHNSGISRYTRNRGPWKPLHEEHYQTRSEAVMRERFLKTGAGRKQLKRLLGDRAQEQ